MVRCLIIQTFLLITVIIFIIRGNSLYLFAGLEDEHRRENMINMKTAEWGLLADVFYFGSMQCFSKVDVCVILLYLLISCPEFVSRHREIDASIKHV